MPVRRCVLLLALAGVAGPVRAAPSRAVPPTVVGTCALTTVRRVEFRLEDGNHRPVPGSGSAIVLANGVYGVSYDRVPAMERSRAGDRVMTCLVSVPRGCPPGDRRGKWYTSTNLRTNEA